ncbi:MAG: A/G-specific adenine glycosylase [Betaproteobacteria bacterium]
MDVNAKRPVFAHQLMAWQRTHGRHDLPWQIKPVDPYRVWLSEIMLQQTQVTTVVGYFERFIARFPTLHALARASEQEVLSLWSGLGYYQRARNLLACAKTLTAQHDGRFPESAQQLALLPGIGPSTAAAIASTVFGERAAILDGNVKRVFARLTCAAPSWGSPALERTLWAEAVKRLPEQSDQMPIYTQAIMDLGALICRPKNPQCGRCPVAQHCQAFQRGQVDRYPVARVRRSLPLRKAYWAFCFDADGIWLTQQPSSGIWPSLWLPWAINPDALPRGWKSTVQGLQEVVEVRHSFTHYRLLISAAMVRLNRNTPPLGAPKGLQRFVWAEAMRLPLPAPVARLLSRLCPAAITTDGELRKSRRL